MLSLIGRKDAQPTPPLSLVGDFGGGGMLLALGVLAALWEARRSGQGQVIDAAMADGAALLGTAFFGFSQNGTWSPERGTNLVDSGAPFYDSYATADGKWVAVGALEGRFYADLLAVLGLDPGELPEQYDKSAWPLLKAEFARVFLTRTRDEWVAAASGLNPCLSPVLSLAETQKDPHAIARASFVTVEGLVQPAPAPRFSRTPAAVDGPPPLPGEHTREALNDWGISGEQMAAWEEKGAIRAGAGATHSAAAG
jgi:alpha-methylacyl-CoA racemase